MSSQDKTTEFRSGFVGIVGLPNAGKSTLFNALMNQDLSIVTHRPQTTRDRIRGILHGKNEQIIIVDTPGIFRAKSALDSYMKREIQQTIQDVDALVFVLDASKRSHSSEEEVLKGMPRDIPCILVLNKADQVSPRERLLEMIERFHKTGRYSQIIPASARKNENILPIHNALREAMPAGPPYYPESMISDRPMRFFVGEQVRQHILQTCRQEVPYASAIRIESYEDKPKIVKIKVGILVEREGQRGILIGKKGEQMKRIMTSARQQIEALVEKQVFLESHVYVSQNWRERKHVLAELGYQSDDAHSEGLQ
jgi:GTP-binding protein Era